MAFAYVQGATQDNTANPNVTVTPTTNNLMCVAAYIGSTGGGLTISDTQVNSWTQMLNPVTNDNHGDQQTMWWAVSKNSNSTTITVNSGGVVGGIFYAEYSGNATSAPNDGDAGQAQVNPGAGTDAVTSGNIAGTTNGDLIVGLSAQVNASAAPAAGTGETTRTASSLLAGTFQARWEDKIGGGGAVASTYTGIALDDYSTLAMAFKAAAGGGAAVVISLLQWAHGM